jgi:hypothetical protein
LVSNDKLHFLHDDDDDDDAVKGAKTKILNNTTNSKSLNITNNMAILCAFQYQLSEYHSA